MLSFISDNPTEATAGEAFWPSRYGGEAKPSIARLQSPGVSEERDDYPTIAILNDHWRVIACKGSIQWILQKSSGPDHWRGRSYCRTRAALVRCVREKVGQVRGDALVILLRLSERFPEAES
jgi:hypothetical protein